MKTFVAWLSSQLTLSELRRLYTFGSAIGIFFSLLSLIFVFASAYSLISGIDTTEISLALKKFFGLPEHWGIYAQ